MKNFISNLIAFAATLLINACFGIAMPTTCAVLISFVLVEYMVYIVYTHVKDKKLPTILQWVQYALVFVMFVLGVCGVNYRSLYCIIIAIIAGIGAVVCGLIEKKKAQEVTE